MKRTILPTLLNASILVLLLFASMAVMAQPPPPEPPASVWGYALITASGGVNAAHSYVSTGDITATRIDPGQYTVTFSNIHFDPNHGHVQVTSRQTGTAVPGVCSVDGWTGSPVTVYVDCKDFDGNPFDSQFSVLVLSGSDIGDGNPNLAYAWSANAAPSGGELDLSTSNFTHNPSGASTTLHHDATGLYRVVFESVLDVFGTSQLGDVQVSAYYNDSGVRFCQHAGSFADTPTAGDLSVVVQCYRDGGQAANTRFTVLATSRQEVAEGYAYAYMNNTGAPADWTGLTQYYNAFGNVWVYRVSTGKYWVRFNGLNTGDMGGDMQVTPVAASKTLCSAGGYHQYEDDDQSIYVECRKLTDGTHTDAEFAVLSTFIGAMPVADEATPAQLADGLTAPSPNPVRGTASFAVAVERGQNVTVEVFDALGRRVRTLYDAPLAAGMSEALSLDASALPAGVYVIRATGEGFVKTRRVTVAR